jgi:hypothetical protein
MKEKEYTIYGIIYMDRTKNNAIATVSANSGKEACSLLEKAIKDYYGYRDNEKLDMQPVAYETKFKTSDKGLIFGYDSLSNSSL